MATRLLLRLLRVAQENKGKYNQFSSSGMHLSPKSYCRKHCIFNKIILLSYILVQSYLLFRNECNSHFPVLRSVHVINQTKHSQSTRRKYFDVTSKTQ